MSLTQKAPELFLVDDFAAVVGVKEIEVLRNAVRNTSKRRARINAHPDSADELHEMIIAIERGSYIRPHIHPNKSESFHIVEGAVDLVFFDEAGEIIRVLPLAAPGGTEAFYYRMSRPFYHTLIIRSDILIVHEITNGPFLPEATVFGSFAPPDTDVVAVARYQADLEKRAAAFCGTTPSMVPA